MTVPQWRNPRLWAPPVYLLFALSLFVLARADAGAEAPAEPHRVVCAESAATADR